MRLLLLLLLLFSCQTIDRGFIPQEHEVFLGKATYVVDAQTFYFSYDRGKVKVQVADVEIPAMKEKKGFEAYEYLRKTILQKNVNVEFLHMGSDGRWIANVTLSDGQSLKEKILQNQ